MLTVPCKNHVDVIRYFANGTWTVGVLLLNRKALCFTLEDAYRTEKLRGQTRIPAGLYELELKPVGMSKFDTKGWNMPPLKYYGMIRVKAVPGFEEILIHPGNTAEDTEGCILVALAANLTVGSVQASSPAYMKVYQPIADMLKKGEPVSILFQDADRLSEGSSGLIA
jgi:hypothetical protein